MKINFLEKNVTTLLEYGLKTFQEHPGIRKIFLVVSKKDFQILQPWAEGEGFILVEGGERRQDSVHKALEHIHQHEELPDMVLIHDGARIFCTTDIHICSIASCYFRKFFPVTGVNYLKEIS